MDNLPVRRPRENAVMAGVCAGLARRWSVDPNLLRIAVVVLSLVYGLGAIAYGAAVVLLPRDGETEPPVHRLLPFTRAWPTPALVTSVIGAGVGVYAILGGFSGGLAFPIIAVAVIWLLVSRRRAGAAQVRTAEPTPFERAAGAWQSRLVEHQRQLGGLPAPVAPTAPEYAAPSAFNPAAGAATDLVPVQPRRRGRARLWWLALILTAIGNTAVALAPVPGMNLTLAHLGATVLGLGITLLVATRRGRPPLLGTLTVLAMLATIGAMAASPILERYGPPVSETRVFTTQDQLPQRLTSVAGDLTWDLSDLTITEDTTIPVDLLAGDVTLKLPSAARTQLDWSVAAGDALVVGDKQDGVRISGTSTSGPGGDSSPLLRLDITMGAGSLKVSS